MLPVRTTHRGKGKFELTPKEGVEYYVVIAHPYELEWRVPIYEKHQKGLSFTIENPIVSNKTEKLNIIIYSNGEFEGSLKISLRHRQHKLLIKSYHYKSEEYEKTVSIPCTQIRKKAYTGGIISISVESKLPHFNEIQFIGERLIFMEPPAKINIRLSNTGKEAGSTGPLSFHPGENVRLHFNVECPQHSGRIYANTRVVEGGLCEEAGGKLGVPFLLPSSVFLEDEVLQGDPCSYLNYFNQYLGCFDAKRGIQAGSGMGVGFGFWVLGLGLYYILYIHYIYIYIYYIYRMGRKSRFTTRHPNMAQRVIHEQKVPFKGISEDQTHKKAIKPDKEPLF